MAADLILYIRRRIIAVSYRHTGGPSSGRFINALLLARSRDGSL